MFLVGPRGRQSPTLPTATSDLRLLPLPRRAAPACGARARAGLPGALLALRDRSARRARVRGATQPRASERRRALGADDRRGAEARPRGRGGIRRRLRDRALVAPAANRADVVFSTVDTVGHPADAPRAGRPRAAAARLHRRSGCPSGSCGSAPGAWSGCTRGRSARRPPIVAYSEHEADVLTTWLRERGADGACRVRAVRRRRRGVPPSTGSRPTSTSSRSGRIPHRDFELLLDGRAGAAGDELPRRDDGRSRAHARRPAGATSRSRPTCRSTRCAAGSSAAASSRFPCATTATRARRRCSCRRWRSPSRSSSRGQPRSRRATGSRTARTCGSSRPATRPSFGRALAEVLGDDEHARALGSRARATVEDALSWEQYVERIEALLRASVGPGAR